MQKYLSLAVITAFLGLGACSQGTDLERAAVGGIAGCLVGDFIEEGECLTGAAVGAAGGALVDDI